MGEKVTFVARTMLGAPIRVFEQRAMAIAWSDTDGRDFPGHTITKEIEITVLRTLVVRRDRSHLQQGEAA